MAATRLVAAKRTAPDPRNTGAISNTTFSPLFICIFRDTCILVLLVLLVILVLLVLLVVLPSCKNNYCLRWSGEAGPRCDGKRQVR